MAETFTKAGLIVASLGYELAPKGGYTVVIGIGSDVHDRSSVGYNRS